MTTDKPVILNDLITASRKASYALSNATRERDAVITAAVSAFRSQTEARVHAEWKERISALSESAKTAKKAMEDAEIADAMDGGRCKYAIGTVLLEWKRSSYGFRTNPLRLTGRRGVVEVITRDSAHPNNRNYSRASAGDVVVRLLGKNGKPGILYSTDINSWRAKWFPEGVDAAKLEGAA